MQYPQNYPKKAEYVIIGGGIIGISSAYHLTKAGKEVVLLDGDELVSQASGRNGGMVVQLDARDANMSVMRMKLQYGRKGLEELKKFQKELDVDFEFEQDGGLDFIFEENELEEMKRFVELQHESGDDEIRLLSREETLNEMPWINEKVLGSRYRKSDGHLYPLKLCFGLVDKAKEMGARFFEHSKVREIKVDSNEVKGVILEDNTYIQSKWVLNCTNAWAEALTPEIKIVPIREVVMLTEQLPKLAVHNFESYIGTLMESDIEQHVWGTTQHPTGNVCIGGPGLISNHFYPQITHEEVINTVNCFRAVMPELDDVRIIRAWCGSFAFTPDYNAYVGHIPNKQGLFVIAGLNNGFAIGPALSKLGCELLLEGEASLDISSMDPGRFMNKNIVIPEAYTYAEIQHYIGKMSSEWLA